MKVVILLILPLLVYQSVTAQCNQDNLLAEYSFTGNTIDESGNNNNGLVFGPTLAEGEMGLLNSAYEFDGIDDWINLGDGESFRFRKGESFTLITKLLVNQTNTVGNILRYDDLDFSDGDTPVVRDLLLFRANGQSEGFNTQFAFGRGPASAGTTSNVISSLYPYDEWHTITAIYDAAKDSCFLYINAQLEGSVKDVSPSDWITTGQFLMIGKYQFGGDQEFFKGKIDELSIFCTAKYPSQDTITSVYEPNKSKENQLLQIYPNPTSGTLNIRLDQREVNTTVQILNIIGKVIYSAPLQSDMMEIELIEKPRGVYIIQVIQQDKISTQLIKLE